MKTITIETFTPSEKLPEADKDVRFVLVGKSYHQDGQWLPHMGLFEIFLGKFVTPNEVLFWYYCPEGDTRQ